MNFAPSQSFIRLAGWTVAVTALFMQIFVLAPGVLQRTDPYRDLIVYYQAAKNVLNGKQIYRAEISGAPDRHPEMIYIYPAPAAVVLAPLGKLSFVSFARVWTLILFAAFWVFAYALALLGKTTKENLLLATLLWGVVLLLFPGAMRGIILGQIDLILLAFFSLGLAFDLRHLWAAAALVKLFYAWPLLIEAAEQRKSGPKEAAKVLWPSITTLCLLITLGGVVCGWDSYVTWAKTVLLVLSQGNFNSDNFSLSFAVLRLLHWSGIWKYSGGPINGAPHLWLSFAAIAGPALTWWLMRRAPLQMRAAAVTAAAALCAPVMWSTYMPVLLPLAALYWAKLTRKMGVLA